MPYPWGPAALHGITRSVPEDFEVFEDLGFEPTGEGEHLLLQVEKAGMTTPELVARIAVDYSIAPRLIGFSGLKDKHAVTTQWLSLHLPGKQHAEVQARPTDGYRILRAVRHRARLRRGTHKSNLFRLRIRGVNALPAVSVEQLDAVAAGGMANYFGPQRFGRGGANVEQALEKLDRGRTRRQQRSLLLSALRSLLFNEVLALRISEDCWRRPVDGDVFMLRGSRSIFSAPLDDDLRHRFEQLDISSSASLHGGGRCLLQGAAQQFELRVQARHPQIVACLERQGARLQMRPLRVAVEDFDYRLERASSSLFLQARLPAGSYATSLLAHFVNASEGAQAALR
jgi:tRNA pseudouridine13 synthase